MAAAISRETEISIGSDRREGIPISGDKIISESTLENLAIFILDNNCELDYDRQTLMNLKIHPLTCDEIKFGIRLIKNHPLISVIENSENKDIAGQIKITMERTIYIKDLHRFGIASDSGLALGSLEAGTSIKIITVSENAWNALNRYKTKLERKSYSSVFRTIAYQGASQPLLHRERSCCEKLSSCIPDKCCSEVGCCIACLAIFGGAIYGIFFS